MQKEYNKYLLDTNFICSLLNHKDLLHQKAKEIFEGIDENSRFIVPITVYLELGVQKIIPMKTIKDFCQSLSAEILMISRSDIDKMNTDFVLIGISMKPIDFSIFYLSTSLEASLITFDEKLSKSLAKPIY
jgi:hypothetical protein